jgi:hypothetical protein
MKFTYPDGKIAQKMHAVFDGKEQLTRWRPCRVATLGALHRSGHKAKGTKRVRERNYGGLTIQSKVFITPARLKEAA